MDQGRNVSAAITLEQSAVAAAPAREPRTLGGGGHAASRDADYELILSFRAGNQDAFDRLYLKYQDYVYNVCLGILANPEDARDCTQEAFLRVYHKVGDFRAEAAFSTWLYRVAVNVCVAQLRRRPKLPTASLEDESVREIPDEVPEAWAGPARQEDEARVRRIVAELPEDYRMLLVLRYFQELSYEEMATVLGYRLSQLKVKLHRARRAFARRWAACGEG